MDDSGYCAARRPTTPRRASVCSSVCGSAVVTSPTGLVEPVLGFQTNNRLLTSVSVSKRQPRSQLANSVSNRWRGVASAGCRPPTAWRRCWLSEPVFHLLLLQTWRPVVWLQGGAGSAVPAGGSSSVRLVPDAPPIVASHRWNLNPSICHLTKWRDEGQRALVHLYHEPIISSKWSF